MKEEGLVVLHGGVSEDRRNGNGNEIKPGHCLQKPATRLTSPCVAVAAAVEVVACLMRAEPTRSF